MKEVNKMKSAVKALIVIVSLIIILACAFDRFVMNIPGAFMVMFLIFFMSANFIFLMRYAGGR